ncbi:hypothetical protein R3P38DRAFT_3269293 [Favolaschia claudopus]|uniref:Uncharacterized protein n=1 Tax=Favolaschia claudopus TaxID=2862362 RepID=A0AAW0BIZ1_9AGAR
MKVGSKELSSGILFMLDICCGFRSGFGNRSSRPPNICHVVSDPLDRARYPQRRHPRCRAWIFSSLISNLALYDMIRNLASKATSAPSTGTFNFDTSFTSALKLLPFDATCFELDLVLWSSKYFISRFRFCDSIYLYRTREARDERGATPPRLSMLEAKTVGLIVEEQTAVDSFAFVFLFAKSAWHLAHRHWHVQVPATQDYPDEDDNERPPSPLTAYPCIDSPFPCPGFARCPYSRRFHISSSPLSCPFPDTLFDPTVIVFATHRRRARKRDSPLKPDSIPTLLTICFAPLPSVLECRSDAGASSFEGGSGGEIGVWVRSEEGKKVGTTTARCRAEMGLHDGGLGGGWEEGSGGVWRAGYDALVLPKSGSRTSDRRGRWGESSDVDRMEVGRGAGDDDEGGSRSGVCTPSAPAFRDPASLLPRSVLVVEFVLSVALRRHSSLLILTLMPSICGDTLRILEASHVAG